MNIINAIAKVRFASAKPQRIQLQKSTGLIVDLLCMEAGQNISISSGQWAYYVVTGTAALTGGGQTTELSAGQLGLAEADEKHTIANAGEGRLVVLATGHLV